MALGLHFWKFPQSPSAETWWGRWREVEGEGERWCYSTFEVSTWSLNWEGGRRWTYFSLSMCLLASMLLSGQWGYTHPQQVPGCVQMRSYHSLASLGFYKVPGIRPSSSLEQSFIYWIAWDQGTSWCWHAGLGEFHSPYIKDKIISNALVEQKINICHFPVYCSKTSPIYHYISTGSVNSVMHFKINLLVNS